MSLTALDLDEAEQEGTRRAQKVMLQAQGSFYAPDMRRQLGNVWRKIKSVPAMEEYYRANMPDDYEQMEKQFGRHRRK